jgi:hypothetical protein
VCLAGCRKTTCTHQAAIVNTYWPHASSHQASSHCALVALRCSPVAQVPLGSLACSAMHKYTPCHTTKHCSRPHVELYHNRKTCESANPSQSVGAHKGSALHSMQLLSQELSKMPAFVCAQTLDAASTLQPCSTQMPTQMPTMHALGGHAATLNKRHKQPLKHQLTLLTAMASDTRNA